MPVEEAISGTFGGLIGESINLIKTRAILCKWGVNRDGGLIEMHESFIEADVIKGGGGGRD